MRLGRISISESLSQMVSKYFMMQVFFTDHCIVSLEYDRKMKSKSLFNRTLLILNAILLKKKSLRGCFREMAAKDVSIFEKWQCFNSYLKVTAAERWNKIAY